MSTQHSTQAHERRQHSRLNRDEKLFLQVTRCDEDEELVGTTVLCATVDVSVSGLKLHTRKEVKAGIELDLWVNIDDRAGKFFLTGSVQWSRSEAGGHCSGIEILDRDNTDIRGWRELFS